MIVCMTVCSLYTYNARAVHMLHDGTSRPTKWPPQKLIGIYQFYQLHWTHVGDRVSHENYSMWNVTIMRKQQKLLFTWTHVKCIHKKRFLYLTKPQGRSSARLARVAHIRCISVSYTHMTAVWRKDEEKKNVDSAAIFKGFTISTMNFIRDFSIDWRKNSTNHSFTHPTHTIKVNLKYSQITVNYRRHGISQWLRFIGNFKKEIIYFSALFVLAW